MPRKRDTEVLIKHNSLFMNQKFFFQRVVVVRTDLEGNLIDYDVVNQSTRSDLTHRSPQQVKQSSRVTRAQTYDNEGEYEDVSIVNDSRKKTRRDTASAVRRIRLK
jgi:hypothetical protein